MNCRPSPVGRMSGSIWPRVHPPGAGRSPSSPRTVCNRSPQVPGCPLNPERFGTDCLGSSGYPHPAFPSFPAQMPLQYGGPNPPPAFPDVPVPRRWGTTHVCSPLSSNRLCSMATPWLIMACPGRGGMALQVEARYFQSVHPESKCPSSCSSLPSLRVGSVPAVGTSLGLMFCRKPSSVLPHSY